MVNEINLNILAFIPENVMINKIYLYINLYLNIITCLILNDKLIFFTNSEWCLQHEFDKIPVMNLKSIKDLLDKSHKKIKLYDLSQ